MRKHEWDNAQGQRRICVWCGLRTRPRTTYEQPRRVHNKTFNVRALELSHDDGKTWQLAESFGTCENRKADHEIEMPEEVANFSPYQRPTRPSYTPEQLERIAVRQRLIRKRKTTQHHG